MEKALQESDNASRHDSRLFYCAIRDVGLCPKPQQGTEFPAPSAFIRCDKPNLAQNKKKTDEKSHKSEEICIKSPETLDRPFKKEYNTILHQYAQ